MTLPMAFRFPDLWQGFSESLDEIALSTDEAGGERVQGLEKLGRPLC